jgi:hypothetical protein
MSTFQNFQRCWCCHRAPATHHSRLCHGRWPRELLLDRTALMQLTAREARGEGYMSPRRIAADTMFIQVVDTACMLLLLEGEDGRKHVSARTA